MDSITSLLIALRALAATGDLEAAAFLRMFGPWAAETMSLRKFSNPADPIGP